MAPRRAPRWARWAIAMAVVVGVVWVALGTVSVLRARAAAQAGLDDLDEVRSVARGDVARFVSSLDDPDGEAEAAGALVRSARDHFADADEAVSSRWTAPLRILPVVGRQVRSVDALAGSAAEVTDAAATAFDQMGEILNAGIAAPEDRVTALRATAAVLDDLEAAMDEVDLGPAEALVGPLADARARFRTRYDEARDQLQGMIAGVAAVDSLLSGPSRYLLLATNNAEMRAGAGMFLQVGELTVADGRFDVGELTPTRELRLPPPGVPVEPDVAARWGFLAPGREWRNTNLTPRFEESGRLTSSMWAAGGRPAADGVISVDVVALGYLLEVVGPVTVDGQVVTAEQVQSDLFLEQYAAFPGGVDEREERYDRLGRLARAVFEQMDQGDWSPEDLLRQVERAAKGRHLLLWSNKEVEQKGWVAASVAGQVRPDSMMLTVLNRGANKLDPYLEVTADLAVDPDSKRISVSVELTNDAPDGLPTYVAGPAPESGLEAGDYLGYVSLTFPGGSKEAAVSEGKVVASGPDGSTQVLAVEVTIPRGESRSLTLSFDPPTGLDQMRVEPSARVPVVEWHAGSKDFTDRQAHEVSLSR